MARRTGNNTLFTANKSQIKYRAARWAGGSILGRLLFPAFPVSNYLGFKRLNTARRGALNEITAVCESSCAFFSQVYRLRRAEGLIGKCLWKPTHRVYLGATHTCRAFHLHLLKSENVVAFP